MHEGTKFHEGTKLHEDDFAPRVNFERKNREKNIYFPRVRVGLGVTVIVKIKIKN